jgi:hypothetical protein
MATKTHGRDWEMPAHPQLQPPTSDRALNSLLGTSDGIDTATHRTLSMRPEAKGGGGGLLGTTNICIPLNSPFSIPTWIHSARQAFMSALALVILISSYLCDTGASCRYLRRNYNTRFSARSGRARGWPYWDPNGIGFRGGSCSLWNDVSFKAAAPLSGSTRLDLLDEKWIYSSRGKTMV